VSHRSHYLANSSAYQVTLGTGRRQLTAAFGCDGCASKAVAEPACLCLADACRFSRDVYGAGSTVVRNGVELHREKVD